ncbi:MAG TPA: SRPBCC family protein [Acidimicrobiales bacterium]|nr:SRPBCC family protein [Acidimicrobiales bacterium]
MAEVKVEGELGAGVEEVWTVVGDFVGMVQGMGVPVEAEGEGVGMTRTIAMGPEPIVERLEELDADAKKVVYSIQQGPLPVQNYVSTMQLTEAGEGRSKLTWSSTFEPVGDEAMATQIVTGIYDGGIKGLQGRFGA